MQAVKAQASLCICTDWPELSLLADVINTEISCTGLYNKSFTNYMYNHVNQSHSFRADRDNLTSDLSKFLLNSKYM